MSFDHQDWTPVVFHKRQKQSDTKETRYPTPLPRANLNTTSGKPAWKVEKLVDGDQEKPIKYINRDDAQKIVQNRVKAKLSQAQLAQRLNMQEVDIKMMEGGKAIENKATISKVLRFLDSLNQSRPSTA